MELGGKVPHPPGGGGYTEKKACKRQDPRRERPELGREEQGDSTMNHAKDFPEGNFWKLWEKKKIQGNILT